MKKMEMFLCHRSVVIYGPRTVGVVPQGTSVYKCVCRGAHVNYYVVGYYRLWNFRPLASLTIALSPPSELNINIGFDLITCTVDFISLLS